MEIYSVNLLIQSKYRKIQTRNNPIFGHFSRNEIFDENLQFFSFKCDFNGFCYSKFPDFENLYTLLTINKGGSLFRASSSSQASHDESALFDFVKPEGGENEIINSAANTHDIEEKHGKGNFNNIAMVIV